MTGMSHLGAPAGSGAFFAAGFAAGFAAAGLGAAGAAFGAGAATGAGAGAGAGFGAGAGTLTAPITLVPGAPFPIPSASSSGSNTTDASPKRMVEPGATGVSPLSFSPSTNVPLVDPRSWRIQTPSRRCSLA